MTLSSFVFIDAPGGTHVRLSGELDALTADELIRRCAALEAEPQKVEVNLEGVTFLDSAGIHALLRIKQTLEGAGHDVTFVEASASCRRVLSITGVDVHLGLATDA